MKMKMKVIPLSVQRGNPKDINVINSVRKANIPKLAKSKHNQVKKETAIVASWFKKSKYKGFKANVK
jgi:hypothetical protein